MLERIGNALIAPRKAIKEARASDIAWLLLFRVIAGETPRIARGLVRGYEGNVQAMVSGIVGAFSAVLPDLLGILIGAILLSLFVRSQRTLDVAAIAWVPYLAVELCGALLFSALGRPMRPMEEHAIDLVAVGWATAVWILGVIELKRAEA